MRRFTLVISLTLSLLFAVTPLSFAQQTSFSLFLQISPNNIEPGEAVSISISTISEPNSTKKVMVRFVSPQESVQQQQLELKADHLGFASEAIEYPNGVATASTNRTGNYTVIIQDAQTGTLIERASFEVREAVGLVNSIRENQAIISAVLAVAVGAGLTYWYNRLSASRETKVGLNQKKAEMFLALRPNYAQVITSALGLAKLLEQQVRFKSVKNLKAGISNLQLSAQAVGALRAELVKQKAELSRITGGKDDFNEEEIERDYHLCFYYLITYVRGRNGLIDKFGAYFLSDPIGEEWLVTVEGQILKRLLGFCTPLWIGELGRILSHEQALPDLEDELRTNYKGSQLYNQFKNWIRNTPENEINQFIRDLNLFSNIMTYETTRMLKEWYPEKEGTNQKINESKNKIIAEIMKQDSKYRSFKLGYLIDQ